MRRRRFSTLLGGAATVLPFGTKAQQAGKVPTVGFLSASTPSLSRERVAAFKQRLEMLGWTEGRTITVEYRWAEGHPERSPEIIAEFVKQNVAVIVTHATDNVIAAKKITSKIPIVFAVAADPVDTGLVASLAQPSGNVTGLSIQSTDLASKRLELLREAVPSLRRLAILVNLGNPASVLERRKLEGASGLVGVTPVGAEVRQADDIVSAFEALRSRADALYVCADPLLNTNRSRISALALRQSLPTMLDNREFVIAGGFMSYGPDITELFRRAADYVDKILRGAKPGDIPIEQPTKFDLVINLRTAKALNLEIPRTLLAVADDMIE
jgi:putative ABC transport system substrate-binding protein